MRKKTGNLPKRKDTVGFQDAEEIVKPSDAAVKLCVSLHQINPEGEKNLSAQQLSSVSSDDPVAAADKCLMDCFYEKLIKVHESSGLSFIFNLGETKLDLYMLYKAVMERDGYNQVSKSGKWEEVALLLNRKNNLSLLPSQFQKIYENILYQYEQMYFYRTPIKVCKRKDAGHSLDAGDNGDDEDAGDDLICSILKRKYSGNASNDNASERKLATDSGQETTCLQYQAPKDSGTEPLSGLHLPIQTSIQTSLDDQKNISESRSAPQPRTAYQIFMKMECDRLKKFHGGKPGTLNFRDMALKEWKNLSERDRQPYMEASQKERERFNKEQADSDQPRKKRKYNKRPKQGESAPKHDGYYVPVDADVAKSPAPDKSFVESTMQVLKNAQPSDPIFQTDWDGFSDFPH